MEGETRDVVKLTINERNWPARGGGGSDTKQVTFIGELLRASGHDRCTGVGGHHRGRQWW
jgi:hypothetical protein